MTGCANSQPEPPAAEPEPEVRTEREREPVPGDYLTCATAPPVPQQENATRRELASYMTNLFDAWNDCHTKVGAIRQWSEQQGERPD